MPSHDVSQACTVFRACASCISRQRAFSVVSLPTQTLELWLLVLLGISQAIAGIKAYGAVTPDIEACIGGPVL